MILASVFLLAVQASGDQAPGPGEHRWQKIERSVSLVCSEESKFTIAIVTAQRSEIKEVSYNGIRVITRMPDNFDKLIGNQQIINADPLGCSGNNGKDGSTWVLSTYSPNQIGKVGKAFVSVIRKAMGWDIIITESSDFS